MTDDVYERGLRTRREVLGDEHVDRALDRATALTQDFQTLITKYAWGEIWSRPGLDRWTRSTALLDAYSETCLRRAWRAEHFSWWMTSMLHRLPDADPFDLKLQLSQLRYVVSSHAAAACLAENYVGLDRV
jgi:hypothetical protein